MSEPKGSTPNAGDDKNAELRNLKYLYGLFDDVKTKNTVPSAPKAPVKPPEPAMREDGLDLLTLLDRLRGDIDVKSSQARQAIVDAQRILDGKKSEVGKITAQAADLISRGDIPKALETLQSLAVLTDGSASLTERIQEIRRMAADETKLSAELADARASGAAKPPVPVEASLLLDQLTRTLDVQTRRAAEEIDRTRKSFDERSSKRETFLSDLRAYEEKKEFGKIVSLLEGTPEFLSADGRFKNAADAVRKAHIEHEARRAELASAVAELNRLSGAAESDADYLKKDAASLEDQTRQIERVLGKIKKPSRLQAHVVLTVVVILVAVFFALPHPSSQPAPASASAPAAAETDVLASETTKELESLREENRKLRKRVEVLLPISKLKKTE